jgi:AAA family ATP:ADP antiporter
VLAGFTHAIGSPYLLGIGIFMLIYSITSTVIYFQQAEIVRDAFTSRTERTAFFANLDLIVNVLTLVLQIFATGQVLRRFGVAITLTALPLISLIGFGLLAIWPTLTMLVVAQVGRRVGNFAFARPSREMLFTVVTREDKYKTKNFLDTVVYRLGDQFGSWSYALLGWLGLKLSGIAIVVLPICALWMGLSTWLGRQQKMRETKPVET